VLLLRRGRVVKYYVCFCICLCVCMFVHSCNSKTTWPKFSNFLYMLPVAVAWSFSDGIAIRYVLLVSWMTSCFHTMGDEWANGLRQNKVAGQTYKFDSAKAANAECNVRQLQCFIEFITMWHTDTHTPVLRPSGLCPDYPGKPVPEPIWVILKHQLGYNTNLHLVSDR